MDALWPVERQFRRGVVLVALAVGVAVVGYQLAYFGGRLGRWDWLFVSGFLTWVAAIYFALALPERVDLALERLHHSGVLTGPLPLAALCAAVHRKAKRAALIGAVVVPTVLTLVFAAALRGDLAAKGVLLTEEVLASVPVGLFVGRACSYGRLGHRLIFLLPGNPVSALCAYDFFAGGAIRALGGRSKAWPYRSYPAILGRKISSLIGRVDYVRVKFTNGALEPLSVSGASVLSSTTRADGFVIVGDDSEGFPAGADVDVWLYG